MLEKYEYVLKTEVGLTPFDIDYKKEYSKPINQTTPFDQQYLIPIMHNNWLLYNYLMCFVGLQGITLEEHNRLNRVDWSERYRNKHKDRARKSGREWARKNRGYSHNQYLKDRDKNKKRYADKSDMKRVEVVSDLYSLRYMQWFNFNCRECGVYVEKQFRLNRIEQYKPFLCQKCSFNKNYDFDKAKEKRIETFEKIYGEGITNSMHVKEYADKTNRRYVYLDGTKFHSSWELALWIYAKDHNEEIIREPCTFEYTHNGMIHHYTPDFLYKGKLIEIKGSQYFENGKMINPKNRSEDDLYEEKYLCGLSNGVEFWGKKECEQYINYVKITYGKDYMSNFDTLKNKSHVY